MENILINKLELASELASEELFNNWSDSLELYTEDSEGTVHYTDEAQVIFNDYYDKYLTLIESTEVK